MLNLQVIGHVGADAVTKDHGGAKFAVFNVAHTDKWKDKEGMPQEKTTWVQCTMWYGENVWPYIKKGTLVCVSGMPEVNAWVKDDKIIGALNLKVADIELLGSSKKD